MILLLLVFAYYFTAILNSGLGQHFPLFFMVGKLERNLTEFIVMDGKYVKNIRIKMI